MEDELIIYNTDDGKADVKLYSKDGVVWMNQQQMALLFDTSKPNISMHIANILQEKELDENSVVKDYLTTAQWKKPKKKLVVGRLGSNLMEMKKYKLWEI